MNTFEQNDKETNFEFKEPIQKLTYRIITFIKLKSSNKIIVSIVMIDN